MNIYKLNTLTPEQRDTLMRRAEIDISHHMDLAARVSEDVRKNGDKAVLAYTQEFDKVSLSQMKVTAQEIQDGANRLDPETAEAIAYAAGNITKFHEKQMPQDIWFTHVDQGIMAGEKTGPIADVCLYVPRGKGSFPSVLLMLGIPALVAGVPKIIVVTPPNQDGGVDDALCFAAKTIGITEIYKVGGIQAVASAAFGTESIPKCHKIIGPGNAYATAAKRVVSGYIDVGLPAGPSESIILCDQFQDPKKVAADWLIEAEHGPDSAALLVTHSKDLVDSVLPFVHQELETLSPKRQEFIKTNLSSYGGVVLTESLEESIEFTNEYAPEHMEVLVEKPFDVLHKIKNAGEILLGEYTPITLCNFLLGPNAILPTGGFAKTYSSVSVFDFLKRSSIGYVSREGFFKVQEYARRFAVCEGFEAHAYAVEHRS